MIRTHDARPTSFSAIRLAALRAAYRLSSRLSEAMALGRVLVLAAAFALRPPHGLAFALPGTELDTGTGAAGASGSVEHAAPTVSSASPVRPPAVTGRAVTHRPVSGDESGRDRKAAAAHDATAEAAVAAYDPNRLLAGHLLRRAGFGPTPSDLDRVVKKGIAFWVNQQLNPKKIGDGAALKALPKPPNKPEEDYDYIRGWYIRMALTHRQLQEKMTLIWHEHFATSDAKVGVGLFMHDQEEFLREHALGSFRDMLAGIVTDQAMLIWLDNDDNDANTGDPPNENFAREFLQLFTMGTKQLNLDGTPMLGLDGQPLPAYTDSDVKEIARALTGWDVPYPWKTKNAQFRDWAHDSGTKTIMGATIPGRTGDDGANEVGDVVDLVLAQRQTTVAAFIARTLIEKLATETPTPGYVSDVANVFAATHGDLKETVRAILLHPEFTSPEVVRSQYREPIEQFIGAIRALKGATTNGDALIGWTYDTGQLIYYPPSVFSYYPPGNRSALLGTATVFLRDKMADEFVRGDSKTTFDPAKLIKTAKLKTPEQTVDYLSDVLLAAPLDDAVRSAIVSYMGGQVTEDEVRGAVWLILCSPDYQRN